MGSEKNVSAVILAAGNSDRMKSPKPFLKWDQKFTFVEKIIKSYYDFKCKKVVVVLNPEGYIQFCEKNIKQNYENILVLVVNKHPEYERFYSIKQGVSALNSVDFCFIQNIDNPFVNISVLEKMVSSVDSNDYYVPTYKGKGGHPVLINKKIIDLLNNTVQNNLKFNQFLIKFNRKNVVFNDKAILFNINTPEEYHKLF